MREGSLNLQGQVKCLQESPLLDCEVQISYPTFSNLEGLSWKEIVKKDALIMTDVTSDANTNIISVCLAVDTRVM